MKKMRTFLFSSVPLWFTFGIQTALLLYMLIVAAIFLLLVAPLATGAHYDIEAFMNFAENMDFMQVFYIVYALCNIIVFGIWYVKRCNGQFRLNIKQTFHPLELMGIVFLIPGTQYLSSIVTSFIGVAFPSWLESYEELMENAGITDEISIIMLIYTVILAPIAEEIIFRGVTLNIAKRAFPFWIANVIQAFFFGVFHFNMVQGIYTFILGLFLGYICEKGSIYHVILFHFLFNLWATTIAEYLMVEDATLQGLIIIVSTIVGITLGLFFFHKGNNQKRVAL